MKILGNGTIWDKENERVLVRFGKKGYVVTEDERTIKILLDMGFKQEKTEEDVKNEEDALREKIRAELIEEMNQAKRGNKKE